MPFSQCVVLLFALFCGTFCRKACVTTLHEVNGVSISGIYSEVLSLSDQSRIFKHESQNLYLHNTKDTSYITNTSQDIDIIWKIAETKTNAWVNCINIQIFMSQ